MLHSRRKRLEELAAQEASGASFWTDEFERTLRRKIVLLARRLVDSVHDGARYLERARELILADEGWFHLHDNNMRAATDMLNYVISAPDQMMPTVIEALSVAFHDRQLAYDTGGHAAGGIFDETVEVLLREHRISFELIDSRMVEFSSRALHMELMRVHGRNPGVYAAPF